MDLLETENTVIADSYQTYETGSNHFNKVFLILHFLYYTGNLIFIFFYFIFQIFKIYESLSKNPYFGAGAGLAALGLTMSMLRKSAIIANSVFRRRCIISLQISNEDV